MKDFKIRLFLVLSREKYARVYREVKRILEFPENEKIANRIDNGELFVSAILGRTRDVRWGLEIHIEKKVEDYDDVLTLPEEYSNTVGRGLLHHVRPRSIQSIYSFLIQNQDVFPYFGTGVWEDPEIVNEYHNPKLEEEMDDSYYFPDKES